MEDHDDDDHRLGETLPLSDAYLVLAQKAAERRLAIAQCMAFDEEDSLAELEPPGSYEELEAPFCGCETCVIREVLSAAWPHLLNVKLAEVDAIASKTLYGPDPEPSIRAMAKILKLVRGEG